MVALLKELLTFNPLKRPAAKESLKNPMFDSIRMENLEADADMSVVLELDDMEIFDYEECVDKLPIEKCHDIL